MNGWDTNSPYSSVSHLYQEPVAVPSPPPDDHKELPYVGPCFLPTATIIYMRIQLKSDVVLCVQAEQFSRLFSTGPPISQEYPQ